MNISKLEHPGESVTASPVGDLGGPGHRALERLVRGVSAILTRGLTREALAQAADHRDGARALLERGDQRLERQALVDPAHDRDERPLKGAQPDERRVDVRRLRVVVVADARALTDEREAV